MFEDILVIMLFEGNKVRISLLHSVGSEKLEFQNPSASVAVLTSRISLVSRYCLEIFKKITKIL